MDVQVHVRMRMDVVLLSMDAEHTGRAWAWQSAHVYIMGIGPNTCVRAHSHAEADAVLQPNECRRVAWAADAHRVRANEHVPAKGDARLYAKKQDADQCWARSAKGVGREPCKGQPYACDHDRQAGSYQGAPVQRIFDESTHEATKKLP